MESSSDLTITNGTVVTPVSTYRASVVIRDGKISAIVKEGAIPRAEMTIDASGLFVLPGIIDDHVHLRDPGYPNKEDFHTGTLAAAAGGITTVFDMPNNIPPVSNLEGLSKKLEAARGRAAVDYGLYGLIQHGNLSDLAPLAEAGVVGFKVWMSETPGGIEIPSDGELFDELAEAARLRTRVAVHAEDDQIIRYRIQKLRNAGQTYPRAHYESRPEMVEEEAIGRSLLLGREAGCALHYCHVSTAVGSSLIREAQLRGQDVTAETCPHYLLLDDSSYSTLGSLVKVNPSIKPSKNRAALWAAVRDGSIGVIATDHAPQTLEEKERPVIFDCLSGVTGLETSVPLMLTQVNAGRLSLSRYVGLASENPAKAWGVFPKKGCISVGSDADLTIVDMKLESAVRADSFLSKSKWSPFEGMPVKGLPVYTILRGTVVMDSGRVVEQNSGTMITPQRKAGQAPS